MDSPNQPEDKQGELLELIGHYDARVYAAVKQGRVAELPREGQILAKVIQEHLGLPHVHNALEVADVCGGEPYEVDGVSPGAHLKMHTAVEEMLAGGNAGARIACGVIQK